MALKLFLLGQFKLEANGEIFELPSRPAQSVLAYLVLNAGAVQRREKLAGLVWPEATESNGRGYLRQALWRIRKSFDGAGCPWEDYFEISDISVSFKERSDYWLDAKMLLEADGDPSIERLEMAVRLYRGELLPGFYDEWIVPERERMVSAYHLKMHRLLDRLGEAGRWADVTVWAETWIGQGYAPEPAFRALMQAHAALGDLAMVSETYQRCAAALDRELGLDPSRETRVLYDSLIAQVGKVQEKQPAQPVDLPFQQLDFLGAQPLPEDPAIPFVSRTQELHQLETYLDGVLAGHGQAAFVIGDAGSGKSSLLGEFTRGAMADHPDLIAATGYCNAHTGVGDPYLPFREILGLLSGDVAARWEAGAISREHARRLWGVFPQMTRALAEYGLDLVGTFIPAPNLLSRVVTCIPDIPDWFERLRRSIVARREADNILSRPEQTDLFEQYGRVLREVAKAHPLVLVLDDLQWADAGSIGLLFQLGRQLAGSRILILGAYRGEEVALRREGDRHPLEPVVNEFQRLYGALTVNLGQADRRDFVEAFLDSEPNRLGEGFRDMLHRQTQGHPLFTIELLRGMQARGDLVRDREGRWVEGSALDWESLPARVEAVIAERIGRLPWKTQAVLQTASVEGEVFTAEVVAQVLNIDRREMLRCLSGELDRQHHLVRAESIQRTGSQLLSRYRFRHILFQRYLYTTSLDMVERVHLHERVGQALEALRNGQDETPAAALELARHFEAAGFLEKAIDYLQQAGKNAVQISAFQEGIAHINRGVDLLRELPESPERDELELSLQLTTSVIWKFRGPTPEGKEAINRTRDLCRQLGKMGQLARMLGELSIYHYIRAEYAQSYAFASEAFSLAGQTGDPVLVVETHWNLGFLKFCLGELRAARDHIAHVLAFYKPEQHHRSLVRLRGVDAGLSALAYEACCLWCLGYPDQAAQRSQEVFKLLEGFDHPFTQADVFCYAGCMYNAMRQEPEILMVYAEKLINIASENDLGGWLGMAISARGEGLSLLGRTQEAIEEIRRGEAISEAANTYLYTTLIYRSLAIAQRDMGCVREALEELSRALAVVEETGERIWEAELYRLRGTFLAELGDETGAEESYLRAVEVAREQEAKSWELRAAVDMARLLQAQNKTVEALEILGAVYDWFSEGFDTPDLRRAKALLDVLSSA